MMTCTRRKVCAALSLIPGAIFMLVFIARTARSLDGTINFTLFDDAMISMTYGRTLAETGEWVWFPGAERVQGFTNPLWTLYMSFIHLIGLEGSTAALAITLTGAALVLTSAVCVMWIVNRASPQSPRSFMFACIAGATVPLLYPLTFWTLRGMEVGLLSLFLLLIIIGLLLYLERIAERRSSVTPLMLIGLSAALGILTRMDFALFAGALITLVIYYTPQTSRIRIGFILVGFLIVPVIIILSFQYLYWGSMLPNTYHLKVDGYPLFERIMRGAAVTAKALPFAFLAAIGYTIALRFGTSVQRRIASACAMSLLLALVYSVWVGGDAWEYGGLINRYIAVALPAGITVGFLGLAVFAPRIGNTRVRDLLWLFIGVSLSAVAMGVVSNPLGINLLTSASAWALVTFFAACWWLAFLLERKDSSKTIHGVLLAASTGLLFIVSTSGPSYWLWLHDGGLFAEVDQELVVSSQQLASVTEGSAVIATAWAGAPVYFSERPAVDLLGKSDEYIASLKPQGPLHPGHNKWDYSYSIGQLQPDVVRELFIPTETELERLESWGYGEFCFGDSRAYFRIGSANVKWELLRTCASP